MNNTITDLLINCEKTGTAPAYTIQKKTYMEKKKSIFAEPVPDKTEPVKYGTKGEDIIIVSDLHIASGKNYAGVYRGTENFFADEAFYRFLDYINNNGNPGKSLLIINGDIFDFLRITEYPGKVRRPRLSKRIKHFIKFDPLEKPAEIPRDLIIDQYKEWSDELKKIGINKTHEELEKSVSKKEKIYGLQTDDYKTIFKLMLIKKGHPVFTDALGNWLEHGHKLIIVKGNHDLELYWTAVRNYLRLILAENIKGRNSGIDLENILTQTVLPNILFIDDSVEIDGELLIEHGHRYDKFCFVLDNPVLGGKSGQINIPFGSFFNRYLINKVELFFPYLDNVRPSGNVLPMLIKENFALALKVLFQHIPFMFRMLFTNFRYIKFMFQKTALFSLAIALPLGFLIYFNYPFIENLISEIFSSQGKSGFNTMILNQSTNIAVLLLTYLLSRFAAWMQLEEPSSLDKYAEETYRDSNYRIITMGHTHNPGEYVFKNGKRFYNTGTWIPIIETSTAEVRKDKTYTFLHIVHNENGKLIPSEDGSLQRWNDDGGRPEPLILIERK